MTEFTSEFWSVFIALACGTPCHEHPGNVPSNPFANAPLATSDHPVV